MSNGRPGVVRHGAAFKLLRQKRKVCNAQEQGRVSQPPILYPPSQCAMLCHCHCHLVSAQAERDFMRTSGQIELWI